MSDPSVSAAPDIGQMILSAPEPLWKQIKSALQVKTREEAVGLVQADPRAQEAVAAIFSSAQSAVSSQRPAPQASAVTSTREPAKRPTSSGKSGVEF